MIAVAKNFVILDNRGSAYLPQYAKLTLRSDNELIKDKYTDILDRTTVGIGERFDRIYALLDHLKREDKKRKERKALEVQQGKSKKKIR